jgi:hypothetical protein
VDVAFSGEPRKFFCSFVIACLSFLPLFSLSHLTSLGKYDIFPNKWLIISVIGILLCLVVVSVLNMFFCGVDLPS